jgi:nicotinate-nucleotide pyrophosphorylase
MGKFLIEVPHEEEVLACARVVEIFLKTGSHFVTHADWGCRDGEHKAWILVDVDNKEEARRILPPAFRSQAKIVSLNKFSMEEIDDIVKKYHREARTKEPEVTDLKREAG